VTTSPNTDVSGQFSLLGTLEQLRSGALTARRSVEASLQRIAAVDNAVHAWVVLDAKNAQIQADRLDGVEPGRRGPLHGLPIGVKDIIDVCGYPTRCGSAATTAEIATADAPFVRALRDAGAVIMGKTVTTEFAYFSPGPTANPRNLGHTPGGSSSGSAAAVASGMVPLALGTQTAASVTRPAAYCGVFSIVLPCGLLQTDGIAGLAHSLDAPGLLGSDALGLAAVLEAILPATTKTMSIQPISKIVVWRPGPEFGVHDEMLTALDRVADRAEQAGLAVEELDYDAHALELVNAHRLIMGYEAARESAAARVPRTSLSPTLQTMLNEGASISTADYESTVARTRFLRAELVDLLETGHAAVLAPAAQGAAPKGLGATGDPIMSRPWQAMGLAAATMPSGAGSTGLPVATQLVGSGDGRALLHLADALCHEAPLPR
jgi:Asp-tRNA(Asn)/Glu-tRNA(Gln) amidotransferase A subunit family amidase